MGGALTQLHQTRFRLLPDKTVTAKKAAARKGLRLFYCLISAGKLCIQPAFLVIRLVISPPYNYKAYY